MSHFKSDGKITEDFLMLPSVSAAITVQKFMDTAKSTTIYGKNSIKILEAMGWPTTNNPNLKRIELITGFNGTSRILNETSTEPNTTTLPPAPPSSALFGKPLGYLALITAMIQLI